MPRHRQGTRPSCNKKPMRFSARRSPRAHTREEVAQIVPMWIASPNRRHGGVFFAGSVVSHEAKGTVSECSIDLGGGKSLPVLVPAAVGEQLKGSPSPVGRCRLDRR